MKKITTLFIALLMSFTLVTTAFAGPSDEENVASFGYKGEATEDQITDTTKEVTSGSETFEELFTEHSDGPTLQVSNDATAIVRDSYLSTVTDKNPTLADSGLLTIGLLIAGELYGVSTADQAQLYLINTSVFSDMGIALSVENGVPAEEGDTEQSAYLYGTAVDTPVAGIGAVSGFLSNLYVYGSYVLSAEIGMVSDSFGKITLGNAADGANNKTLSKVLKQSDKDAIDAKTETLVEGGRNALVIHSVNLPYRNDYKGYSKEEMPLLSTSIKATNSTLKVDSGMDMEVPYEDPVQAYIDHTKGSVILVKSTNASINLNKCKLETDKESSNIIIQTVPTNDTMYMNAVPDGKTYDGVKVFMKSMTVEGDVVHEDYQRDLKLTLSGTKLTGSVNGYGFDTWKQTAEEKGFEDFCVDKEYKTKHGAEVSLIKKSTWEVSARSELTRLSISKDSMVVGEIYVNGKHVTNEPKEYKGEIVVLPAGSSIPETHVHSYAESSRVEPTCGKEGSVTYLCDCGDSYTETLKALEHNYVRDNGGCPPDCEHDGVKPYICTICGDTYDEVLKSTGHVYVLQNTVASTCQLGGYDLWVCNQCGDKDYRNIKPAIAHEMYEQYYIAPSCLGYGASWMQCKNCVYGYTEEHTDQPPLGHNLLIDYTRSYEAGCFIDKAETYYCTNCPYEYVYTYEGTARGYHMYGLLPYYDAGMEATQHLNVCKDCGHREYDSVANHNWAYSYIDNTYHKAYCSFGCGYETQVPHANQGDGTCICGYVYP